MNKKCVCLLLLGLVVYIIQSNKNNDTKHLKREKRCGVDLPSCNGLRCINGYCKSDHIQPLPRSQLPFL